MPELAHHHKKTTSTDRLSILSQDTHRLKSFQKLGQDSILRGESSRPFWNELSQEISNNLSLPTPGVLSDSDLNWLSGYASVIKSNSWFSTTANCLPNKNLLQICCPSSTVSVAGFTGCENTEKKSGMSYGKNVYKKSQNRPPNSLVKIPIFPCKELHLVWKQWLAAYRWVYNQCVQFFNSGQQLQAKQSLDQYIQQLQKLPENQWTSCLGKTRQEAVCEAELAYKQALKAWKAKPISERGVFKLKYRSCRNNSQAIQLKNDAYKKGSWFPTKVKGLTYTVARSYQLPESCVYGTELVYQNGKWFGCFPQYIEPINTGSDKVIALDPGNRCFLTGYDGENILEIGKGDIGRIYRLCLHLDKLISRKVKATGKVNKRLRFKLNSSITRLRFKIKALVNDLHHKAAALLTNSYKLIFLPTYNTSEMVIKGKRKINKKSVRGMLTWSFGRFASHLIQQAKRKGVIVIRTNESYTSKSCPICGKLHNNLGGSKTFKCPSCGYKAPRDYVGAVNNMLSALQAVAFSIEDDKLVINDADVVISQLC